VIGSGTAEGIDHSVSLYVPGQSKPNTALLATHGGTGELRVDFAHLYSVVREPGFDPSGGFTASTTFYQYIVLDYSGTEIVVYDWAPSGPSPVRTPHLHVPAAGSIVMAQRANSPLAAQKTFLGSLHLPTGSVVVEDIVELLIREFQVVPRRVDWEEVLAAGRAVAVE
jgi:hypothetical protein